MCLSNSMCAVLWRGAGEGKRVSKAVGKVDGDLYRRTIRETLKNIFKDKDIFKKEVELG